MQKEAPYEKQFVKHALKRRCLAIKLIMLAKKGWPDRTIFGPSRLIFFIEFKAGKNKTSPHQNKWKRILTILGFNYYVVYNLEEAKTCLETEIGANKSNKKVPNR